MYTLMSALGAITVLKPRLKNWPLAAFLFACIYGLVLECLQTAIVGVERSGSIGDLLANSLGAFTGAMGIFILLRLRRVAQKDS